MNLHCILGSGGAVANALVPTLLDAGIALRLVARNPQTVPGTEAKRADLTDLAATKEAVKGCSVAYLVVGLPYDSLIWAEKWPKMISNVIEACSEVGCRLVFFDNVYMYGLVEGPMTEETPFKPISRKGEIRARIAEQLLESMAKGKVNALIARCADFYGPTGGATSLPNLLVFEKLAKGKPAQWIGSSDQVHSYTYLPDAVQALYRLGQSESSFGQTWHLPTSDHPLTGREFVHRAAWELGAADRFQVLSRLMMSVVGLFDRTVKEALEMAYQSEKPYEFSSMKFDKAFQFHPTPYEEGIRQTALAYR